MTVSQPENAEITLHPEGTFGAVCCDVFDVGVEETQYGKKRRVLLAWETTEDHPDFPGPHRVNRKYTASLHQQASLRRDLESWRGQAFTEEELRGFDLETLLGVPVTLTIQHVESGGTTYANVVHVGPARDGIEHPAEVSDEYTRIKDRDEDDENEGAAPASAGEPNDKLPF